VSGWYPTTRTIGHPRVVPEIVRESAGKAGRWALGPTSGEGAKVCPSGTKPLTPQTDAEDAGFTFAMTVAPLEVAVALMPDMGTAAAPAASRAAAVATEALCMNVHLGRGWLGPRGTGPDDPKCPAAGLTDAFAELSRQNRYAILHRVQTAKKAETRERRIAKYVGMLAAGETP